MVLAYSDGRGVGGGWWLVVVVEVVVELVVVVVALVVGSRGSGCLRVPLVEI